VSVELTAPVRAGVSGVVVFVGNTNVDLQWYPLNPAICDGYIIQRNSRVTVIPDPGIRFYRDATVKGQIYTYRWSYFKGTNEYTFAPVQVTAGEVEGRIYQDLVWPSDRYVIHGAVDVDAGRTLTVLPGAELVHPTDKTDGRLGERSHGTIQIEGATVRIPVYFLTTDCSVVNSTFAGISPTNRTARLVLNADQTVTGCVFSNSVIEAEGEVPEPEPGPRTAWVRLEDNTLTNVGVLCQGKSWVTMTGHRQAERVEIIAAQEARLSLVDNWIQKASIGIRVLASATIVSNILADGSLYTWARAPLVVQGNVFETTNRMSGIAITLALWDMYSEGSDFSAQIQNNVISGAAPGQGYGYGIAFRSTGVMIPGQTEIGGNTVKDCDVAILVEGDSPVVVSNNCLIDCWEYGAGLTVRERTWPLNAAMNWWGDPSGPRLDANPGGTGTPIKGNSTAVVSFIPCRQEPAGCLLGSALDLVIKEITFCQVVENVAMLVEAKPFAVKVVVGSSATTDEPIPLQFKCNNAVLDEFYERSEANIDDNLKFLAPSRTLSFSDQLETVVYFFPPALPYVDPTPAAQGQVTVSATVDPENLLHEKSEMNNQRSKSVPVVAPVWHKVPEDPYPEALFVSHLLEPEVFDEIADNALLRSWLTRYRFACRQAPDFLPVSFLNYDSNLITYGRRMPKSGVTQYAILRAANPFIKILIQPRIVIDEAGAYPLLLCLPFTPQHRYLMLPADPAAPLSYYRGVVATAYAYEAGFSPGSLRINDGIDVRNNRLMDDRLAINRPVNGVRSLMGVMQLGTELWLDQVNYEFVLKETTRPRPPVAPIKAASQEGVAIVSGTVFRNGSGQLNPVLRMSTGSPDVTESGPYQVSLFDTQNQSVASVNFTVNFVTTGPEGLMEAAEASFAVTLPWTSLARSVVLSRDGVELASLRASAREPMVGLLSPVGGEEWNGIQTVRWQAEDSDGDSLSFTILYSPDLGHQWDLLAMNLSGREWQWDTSESGGAKKAGLIRIIATDGFNAGEAFSPAPFSVSFKPPRVWIDLPLPDACYPAGEDIVFRGWAFDPKLGDLSDTAYSWSVDPGGVIGQGCLIRTHLAAGDYRVSLSVLSTNGFTVTNQVNIHVGTMILPDLNLEPASLKAPVAPETGGTYSLSAFVGNRGSSADAAVNFYDGTSLLGVVTNRVAAQDWTPVTLAWTPSDTGRHLIQVSVADLSGREQATNDNEVQLQVTVTSGDQDQDGLPDWWETRFFGQPTAAVPANDSDGDGQSNLNEYRARTIPTEPFSCFRIESVEWNTGRGLVLRWSSVPGLVYAVEHTTDFTQPFAMLTNGLAASGTQMTCALIPPPSDCQLYRLRLDTVVPPLP